jgi:hypothetical protein
MEKIQVLEAPADFLTRATPGYCGPTTDRGNCEAGNKGALLNVQREKTWHAAIKECLELCASCSRCRYVSLSPRWYDCSWYHECDLNLLKTDVPSFVSGTFLPRVGHNASRGKGGFLPRVPKAVPVEEQDQQQQDQQQQDRHHQQQEQFGGGPRRRSQATPATQKKRQQPAAVANGRRTYTVLPCDHVPSAATIEVTDWTGDGFGYQLESGVKALHRAACCAGVALLPANRQRTTASRHATLVELVGERAALKLRCFNFSGLPRVAGHAGACASRRDASQEFFWAEKEKYDPFGHPCPSAAYYMRPAMLAAMRYTGLGALRCDTSIDFGSTLVAHIRGGDIFGYQGHNLVHPYYSQPSLVYYLSAWAHSGMRKLLVLSEDTSNPVVRMLTVAQRFLARGAITLMHGRPFAADLSVAMCARKMVLAHTSLQRLFLASHRLRAVYTHTPLDPEADGFRAFLLGSCATRVYVARELLREPRWANTDSQLLAMLVDNWNGTYAFDEQREPPLHCLGLGGGGVGGGGGGTHRHAHKAAATAVADRKV